MQFISNKLLLLPIAVISIWVVLIGCRAAPLQFQVRGFSMFPTLLGKHAKLLCSLCNEVSYIELDYKEQFPCWYCATMLDPQVNTKTFWSADEVALQPYENESPIRRGDLIAIHVDSILRVKRVLAVPGDTVLIDERKLRTFVPDTIEKGSVIQSPNSETPRVLIDRCTKINGDSRWKLDRDGWYRYHHIAVYDAGLKSQIYDDYPCNVEVVRKMVPVTDLVVRFRSKSSVAVDATVAFWTEDGTYQSPVHINPETCIDITTSEARIRSALELTASNPIAIHVNQNRSLVNWSLWRTVEYRLRRNDDSQHYPITLDDDSFFVVGDNVPISVDSREWGPITRHQIRGRVGMAKRGTQIYSLPE